ncbi:structure-specific endonuclease subunit SLX4 isoform X1 [Anguilla anguilla]|uniref:structure-specific endonuclease subunit SLX4 isoform X1 n=1 Tax=Anguilla anguilla TaxID=7936 RepID=UPI0015B1F2DD|nr:structure-specific endonuclease subunit SLX4 isoform X1 [Anguilla anguilla]XP_035259210.1 structure-specific endonuclease subunit SLX4 isoform X1 [Anguilla anguilla]XP_035259211.1 structure-specific endonuclease subunit SLX4 isoform X1 [Anguilla anguilla]XP_035259213.1 structure-specific endonuclease subunit SLX4 isoform X1 [Anguilla anguilla]
MDDSDLDFADLCSKLLKRVRKKERGESGDERGIEASQNRTQNVYPTQSKDSTKRRKPKQDAESSSRKQLDCQSVSASQFNRPVREEGTGQQCVTVERAPSVAVPQTPSSQASVESAATVPGLVASQNADVNLRVKDKVVLRMQQFRWVSPQKMTHMDNDQPRRTALVAEDTIPRSTVPHAGDPLQGPLGDEALALRLQEELDREEKGPQEMVDLEQGGLFFCQICQRDLSALSPLRRTQHINRCLDESEGSGPAAPAPPAVPECPICGKMFKHQKSRASHMKRCSAEMGVSSAVLLQALQRQAAETASDSAANQPPPAGGSKRKGSLDPPRPPKKRQRKKAAPLDEDTMVALALSRSMVEQEREREKEREALITAPAEDSVRPGLQWRADAGKRRGKKKGHPPAPPPILLVQDSAEALRRLQDRVASLLLRARPPTPPTPPRPASRLPGWTGAAPLWQKSALRDEELGLEAEFYTPALCPPVQPWAVTEEMQTVAPPAQAQVLPPAGPPLPEPSTPCPPSPSTPGLGSQTFGDLMDLAEEGLTLSQWGYAPKADHAPDSAPKLTPGPREDRDVGAGDLRLSGFLPERRRSAAAAENTGALFRLTADLSSMVNNPQLSDVQLQVDSGEVFFAHSFMLYARCPLLVQMVHDSGFGVEEEGMPSARRVLLGDLPPEAVHVLLQYLYCARCPLTPVLVPHLMELALRLDLRELEQVCQGFTGGAAVEPWVESREQEQRDEEEEEEECVEQKFLELLRSMWEEEEEAEEGGGGGDGEGEEVEGGGEGRVDEEELLEIYQFAATQRRCREEEEEEKGNVGTETEEEVEHREKTEDGFSPVQTASHHHSNCLTIIPSEPGPLDWLSTDHMTQEGSEAKQAAPIADHHSGTEGAGLDRTSQPSPGRGSNTSLERSYDRLFSETWGDYAGPSQQNVQSSRSQGALIDLSISPLPDLSGSSLPIAGVSPEPATGQSCSPHTPTGQALKQKSLGCSQISPMQQEGPGCSQISPTQREPELIVLSDSGEESYTPGPPSPPPRPLSPSPRPPQAPAGDFGRGGGSPEDSCAEMSWLVPGTPDPPARTTRVSSTQIHCTLRRTRLFATLTHSSSSSSASSASLRTGAAPVSVRLAESRESAVPRARPPTPSTAPQSDPAHDLSSPAPTSAAPPTSSRQSRPPSFALAHPKRPILDGMPSRAFPYPASSTPLPPQTPSSVTLPPREERHLESMGISARSSTGGSPPLRLCLSDSSPSSPRKRASPEGGRFSAREDERGEEGVEGGAEEEEAFPAHMEDPPMAFDESWGLDGGGGRDLRFSLRLDSSTGASQSRQGSGETTPPAPPPPPSPGNHAQPYTSLLDSKIWDDWEAEGEDEDEEGDRASLPLSQRVQPMAVGQRVRQLKTPVASRRNARAPLVPITPMPGYSDMDTPELKNKLNRFGVRPLPKRQMVLKLKEIHQYTHQLLSSGSEEDGPAPDPIPSSVSTAFKQPERPAPVGAWSKYSTHKQVGPEQEGEGLSASQGSTASSTAASEDSERSNPELCSLSDSDGSDSEGVTASQAGARGAERLQAVRSFILSDPELYGQVLRYEPLVLSQLQARLKARGIRLAAAKLLDFLDSQCITFTTAKPAKPGPPRGRGRGRGRRRGRPAKASD